MAKAKKVSGKKGAAKAKGFKKGTPTLSAKQKKKALRGFATQSRKEAGVGEW